MKKKIGVIFGGKSSEHDVSILSGQNVIKYLNKDKYKIVSIFINKDGDWLYSDEIDNNLDNYKSINNIFDFLKKMDVIFPVLHGKYGEDGTIQGLFELLDIPYVGCGVMASSLAMDKFYTKTLISKTGIKQAKDVGFENFNNKYYYIDSSLDKKEVSSKEMISVIEDNISYPMFIKPANYGSSIGISKVKKREELKNAIDRAFEYDKRIVIEEQVVGREIECAVLGNVIVRASSVGEIVSNADFYTYDAKYQSAESQVIVPAKIDDEVINKIRECAIKVYRALDCRGLSRVDFFVDNSEIYFNEINTLPGFTNISMYPKLWEYGGIGYGELLDMLIELAIDNKKF